MDFAIRDLLANTRIPKRPYPPAVHQHVYPMAYPTVSQAPHPPVHQTVPPQALNTTRTSLSNGYQFNATAAPVTSATPATFSPALAATSASTAPYVHPHARQRYPPQPEKRNSKKNKKPNSNHNHSKKRKSGPRPPFPFPNSLRQPLPPTRSLTCSIIGDLFPVVVHRINCTLLSCGLLRLGMRIVRGNKDALLFVFFTTFKNLDLSHFTVSAGIFGRNQFQCTESIDGFPLIDVTKPFLEDVSTFHVRPPEFELKIATRMATSDKSRVVGCVMLLNELNRADRLAKVYESTLRLHEDYSKPLPLGFTIAPDVSRDVSLLKERLIEVRHYRKPQKGPPGERVILSDDENHNGQTQARVEMEDIEIGDTVVSFSCLISLSRIEHPARGKHCRHPQCFDAKVFLQMASLNVTWKCGVCNEFIFPQDLIIDASFLNLLLKYPDADKCTLLADGTDMPYQPSLSTTIDVTGDAPGNMNRKRKRGRSDEVICILDDHSDNDLEDGELSGNESDASHLTISSTGSASRRRSRKRKNKPSFFTEDANGVLILD
ncbi:hypothetical protein BC829DRAFT_390849 [Chytridium lagenaria]|nr:hypothetical protein BC829DRAFT_390849 [Chytridium lagenaria]